MKFGLLPIVLLGALLFAACQSDDPLTPVEGVTDTATPEAGETPVPPPLDILPTTSPTPTATPPPTPTPLPPATPSGLWVFDLGSGKQALLYDGAGDVTSQIESTGRAVTVHLIEDGGTTASRFRSDGELIETHADRGMIVSSTNGEYRFYLDLADPETPALVLERQGELVRLEGTRPRLGVSFSPTGDRLLTVSERPGQLPDEVVRTFSVHETADGRLRMQFEHRALLGSPAVARWSPSGRFVADEGIEGLFVRDTVTGRAWLLGPGGSAHWSPLGDQLLAVSELGRLAIVDVPELTGVDLGLIEGPASVRFDRSGRLAIVTTYGDAETRTAPTTRAFDVDSGDGVAVWAGLDTADRSIGGAEPAIALGGGVAAVFGSTSCVGGFVVVHPGLGDEERCLTGANPRWSPNGEFLVYARERELVVLGASSDSERVIVRGTPPADGSSAPLLRWSPDGSWLLIEWNAPTEDSPAP